MIRAYDDFGNVVDLVEWEKQIRAEVIDLIDRHLWNYSHEVWEDFKPILEQLKGAENDRTD